MIISKSLAEAIHFFYSFLGLYALSLTGEMLLAGEYNRRHLFTLVGSLLITISGKIVTKKIQRREERKRHAESEKSAT